MKVCTQEVMYPVGCVPSRGLYPGGYIPSWGCKVLLGIPSFGVPRRVCILKGWYPVGCVLSGMSTQAGVYKGGCKPRSVYVYQRPVGTLSHKILSQPIGSLISRHLLEVFVHPTFRV